MNPVVNLINHPQIANPGSVAQTATGQAVYPSTGTPDQIFPSSQNNNITNNTPANIGAVAGGGGGGGASGSTYNPAIANAINQNYAEQQRGYQALLDQLDPNYQANTGFVGNQYNNQNQTLQDQYNAGLNSNKLANAQLETSRTNTLRDLTHQMQGMIQGYGNQLGTYGAGDSSAAGLINYALTNQGNRSINDANQQAAYQQTGLNNQSDNLQKQYEDQYGALNNWRDQSLSQLAQAYDLYKQHYQNAITGSQTQQSQMLASYGAHPDSTLLNALQNLDKSYTNAKANLDNTYTQASPGVDLSQYNSFAVNPITQQQLQGANFTPVQTQPVNAPVSIRRTTDQTQQGL